MKFINQTVVLVFFLLTFIIGLSAQDDNRVNATWQVQKYELTAALPPVASDRTLSLRAVLNLKNVSSGPVSRVTLRLSDKADVADVKVNGATGDFSKGNESIGAGRNLLRAIVRVPSVAPGAAVSVEVNYKLKVDENTGLNALTPVGSQFLPLSFWYPTPNSWYFARGADYAPFTIKASSPNGLTILSSGAEISGGFEQKLNGQPFFIAGSWDKIEAAGISVYVPKGSGADEQQRARDMAALVSEAKVFMADRMGPAPELPLRIVSAKRGAGFSGGGTILVDDSVFRRQKIDSLTAMTIAESVAKVWLGNAIQVSGDGYGTLREGLPRYLATQFIEQKYGVDIADVERLRQRTAYAAAVKRDAPLNIVSPLDDYYYTSSGNKGAMIWRLLAKKIGSEAFFKTVRENAADGALELRELRADFSVHKDLLDYSFDQITDVNLLVGLPQTTGGETKIALRNTGSGEANVSVAATTGNGEKLMTTVALRPKSFGEVTFKTPNKIVRVEVDAEKLYPQIDYSDDVAPREFDESDLLLSVKRRFDKQDFADAEQNARLVLRALPRFDDVRILLARSLAAQGKLADAEKEFRAVLNEKLPAARSLAWANVGLGEIAAKAGQKAEALQFFTEAIEADGEYGATLAARVGRNNLNVASDVDESIKAFFRQFDKAAVSNSKTTLEALIMPGEVAKFAAGIAGQTEQWTTAVLHTDPLDANNLLVETRLSVKLLNREVETGTGVFRLSKIGGEWKLSGVDLFEVR